MDTASSRPAEATRSGTAAGGISVVIIFITLCIAVCGLLAALTASNELALNTKNRDASADYYAADAAAAAAIAAVHAAARNGEAVRETGGIVITYDEEGNSAEFTVPIDAYRELSVAVDLAGGAPKLLRYCVVGTRNWQDQTEDGISLVTDISG